MVLVLSMCKPDRHFHRARTNFDPMPAHTMGDRFQTPFHESCKLIAKLLINARPVS
jgi:hypothetical protein